jgi:hypothetical protein
MMLSSGASPLYSSNPRPDLWIRTPRTFDPKHSQAGPKSLEVSLRGLGSWKLSTFPCKKAAPLFGIAPKDQLLFQWHRAADFSARLTLHSDCFYMLLKANELA